MAKLGVGIPDTGGTVFLLEVIPDLFDSGQVGDGSLDRGGHLEGDVAKGLFIMLIS